MRLSSIWIEEFKNIHNIEVNFDKNHLVTVLIGRNGTAKSNLIEALACIFQRLDLVKDPPFRYILKYECKEVNIEIDADPERKGAPKVEIKANKTKVAFGSFVQEEIKRKYLPNTVFGYYSGSSKRLERYFRKHQRKFLMELLKDKEKPLRPLFYAKPIHSQYVLMSFYSFEDNQAITFLKDYFGITDFIKASFLLKEPDWYNKSKAAGDPYWGAMGKVRGLIDNLHKYSTAPAKIPVEITSKSGKKTVEEMWYFRIEGVKSLRALAAEYHDNVNFFKILESLHASDLIHKLTIEVRKENASEGIKFSELSEGEQQLLTVLGLLRFTKEKDSLFLLDEPDTHLHPSWKLNYISLLKAEVEAIEKSHILIATHDPLTIGGLKKQQVQVFQKNKQKQVIISNSIKDTTGMGVNAMLLSELFDLPTILDNKAQNTLDEKIELAIKKKRSEKDELRLQELNRTLEEMGFYTSFRDPYYARFLKLLREYNKQNAPVLSLKDKEVQANLTRKLMKQIKGKNS